MTSRDTRKTTTLIRAGRKYTYIPVGIPGISWHESLEAALGFLVDETVPIGSFAADDLDFLISVAQDRLAQVLKENTR